MKKEFVNYLTELGMTEPLLQRVSGIVDFYSGLMKEEIKGIFVSEYVDPESKRTYESLWLFAPPFNMEAKKFLSEDDFDCAALTEVRYWNIKKKEYDFKKATTTSRLTLDFAFGRSSTGTLKASGANCDTLKQMFIAYIHPHVK